MRTCRRAHAFCVSNRRTDSSRTSLGQPNPLPTKSRDQRGVTGAPTAMAAIVQVTLPFAVK